ncbi:MAG: hypothetical protein ACOH5I_15365 [Oligoflexus sp.]
MAGIHAAAGFTFQNRVALNLILEAVLTKTYRGFAYEKTIQLNPRNLGDTKSIDIELKTQNDRQYSIDTNGYEVKRGENINRLGDIEAVIFDLWKIESYGDQKFDNHILIHATIAHGELASMYSDSKRKKLIKNTVEKKIRSHIADSLTNPNQRKISRIYNRDWKEPVEKSVCELCKKLKLQFMSRESSLSLDYSDLDFRNIALTEKMIRRLNLGLDGIELKAKEIYNAMVCYLHSMTEKAAGETQGNLSARGVQKSTPTIKLVFEGFLLANGSLYDKFRNIERAELARKISDEFHVPINEFEHIVDTRF